MPEKEKESESSKEESDDTSNESGFKTGTPEWIAWRAERQQDGKRRAKEQRELEEKKRMAEAESTKIPRDTGTVPSAEIVPKPKETEQKDERLKGAPGERDMTEIAAIVLGLMAAIGFLALLYTILSRRKKAAAIDTTAKPAPEPAPASAPTSVPEPASVLEPAGPNPGDFNPTDNPYDSVLGPHGKLK